MKKKIYRSIRLHIKIIFNFILIHLEKDIYVPSVTYLLKFCLIVMVNYYNIGEHNRRQKEKNCQPANIQ